MITREQFDKIDNCQESLAYVAGQPSLAAAWDNCERPDWLLAFAHKAGIASKEQFVRVAIGEAEIVLHIWTAKYPDDDRPQRAIQAAKDWLGDQTSALRTTANAADTAIFASAAVAAVASAAVAAITAARATAITAAYASTYAYAAAAAYAANASAADAAAAYASAYAYAIAIAVADDADDKVAFLRTQCDRIRAIIPNPFIDHEGDKQ